jgi:hypothetical protein
MEWPSVTGFCGTLQSSLKVGQMEGSSLGREET